MAEKKTTTFRELYDEEKRKPTAAQAFITEVAGLTKRSEVTVKMWANGIQAPDELAKTVIAKHFGVAPEGLFPDRRKEAQAQA